MESPEIAGLAEPPAPTFMPSTDLQSTMIAFEEGVGRVVVPIYRDVDGYGLAHEGSAVLVRSRSIHLLFTAKHVSDACKVMILGSSPNLLLTHPAISHKDPVDLAGC